MSEENKAFFNKIIGYAGRGKQFSKTKLKRSDV